MPRKPPRWDSGPWKRIRKKVLNRDGHICYACGRPATCVDHIIPRGEAPHLNLVMENLRASCDLHNYGRVSIRRAAMRKHDPRPGNQRDW